MTASTLNLALTFTDTIRAPDSTNRAQWNSRLVDVIKGINSGATVYTGVQEVVTNTTTTASGTVTFSSTGATNGDTVTVGGTAFTAAASPSGNQFNSGTNLVLAASSLAAAINATATTAIKGAFYATSDGVAVVTIFSAASGAIGNQATLAKSGTNIAVSGAKLAGGASDNAVVWTY